MVNFIHKSDCDKEKCSYITKKVKYVPAILEGPLSTQNCIWLWVCNEPGVIYLNINEDHNEVINEIFKEEYE